MCPQVQAGREDPAVQDSIRNSIINSNSYSNANTTNNGEGNSGGGVARPSVSWGVETTASGILGRRQQLAGRDRVRMFRRGERPLLLVRLLLLLL